MLTRRSMLGAATAASVLSVANLSGAVAQSEISTERGVVFASVDGQDLMTEIYRPSVRSTARPAVILIHGGGWWSSGRRTDLDWAGSELASAGYVCFTIDYRFFDATQARNPWPAQLDDAQRAVRWIRANAAKYNVDPDRIAAFGHSAGGQLAALLGLQDSRDTSDPASAEYSSRVTCVIDIAGYNDLTIPDPNPHWPDFLASYLGGTPEDQPEAYREASPITWLKDQVPPPFLLVSGGTDTEQPLEDTWGMAVALRDAGGEVACAHFPNADHYQIKDWNVCGPITLAFLGEHLNPAI